MSVADSWKAIDDHLDAISTWQVRVAPRVPAIELVRQPDGSYARPQTPPGGQGLTPLPK